MTALAAAVIGGVVLGAVVTRVFFPKVHKVWHQKPVGRTTDEIEPMTANEMMTRGYLQRRMKE